MAAAPGAPADAGDDYKKLCAFRELFKGRFTDSEAAVLLEKNRSDPRAAVGFVLSSSPEEVRAVLEEDAQSWTLIQNIKNIRRRSRDIFARARSGQIDTSARQFACRPCDRMWWRRCPNRKLVSKCNTCKERYDAVPRDREWGWGEFTCPHDNCGNVFGGYCQMGTTSPCFRCGKPVYPTRIRPPSERGPQMGSNRKHHCHGRNCGGRPGGQGAECVHPSTRRLLGLPLVVTPSQPHDSTGSTIDTFLSQADLNKDHTDFFPCLPSIPENPGEDWGDESMRGSADSD